jgi:hypothetical protein
LIDRQSCLKMTYTTLDPPKGANFYAQAWNAAQQYGGFARDALDVYQEANYYGNFMVYSMFYFPERDGLPPGPWASGNLDPARQKYLRSLVGWAQGFQHWVIDGAKNAL